MRVLRLFRWCLGLMLLIGVGGADANWLRPPPPESARMRPIWGNGYWAPQVAQGAYERSCHSTNGRQNVHRWFGLYQPNWYSIYVQCWEREDRYFVRPPFGPQ
jgi:hypothetical protein